MSDRIDDVDKRQQKEIDNLAMHAETNKRIDMFQWIAIVAIGLGIMVYLNICLVSALKLQVENISKLVDICVKK